MDDKDDDLPLQWAFLPIDEHRWSEYMQEQERLAELDSKYEKILADIVARV